MESLWALEGFVAGTANMDKDTASFAATNPGDLGGVDEFCVAVCTHNTSCYNSSSFLFRCLVFYASQRPKNEGILRIYSFFT